jgi:hypothetical protein
MQSCRAATSFLAELRISPLILNLLEPFHRSVDNQFNRWKCYTTIVIQVLRFSLYFYAPICGWIFMFVCMPYE